MMVPITWDNEFQIGNSPGTNIMKNINPVIRYVESDVILGPIHY
jgi:hypothetical protein